MQEPLEDLHLGEAVKEGHLIKGILRRSETPTLHRLSKPDPLLSHAQVIEFVARRPRIDGPQERKGLKGIAGPLDHRSPDEFGREMPEVFSRDVPGLGAQGGVPRRWCSQGVEARREVSVHPDGLREADGARKNPGIQGEKHPIWSGRKLLEERPGLRVHGGGIVPVPLVELGYVPSV